MRCSNPTADNNALPRGPDSSPRSVYRDGSKTLSSADVRANKLNCWKTNPTVVDRICANSISVREDGVIPLI